MNTDLAQEAISLALSGNWQGALKINEEILKENPSDVDALNRLARAYSETGNFRKAKETAQKVLKIDPFNTIATKSIEKWKGLKKGETYSQKPSNPHYFLEEPGKTKILTLIHAGSPKVLAKLDSGDEIHLNTHSHRVCVQTVNGKYIGRLPDDLSARLRKLIQLGNTYQVIVKSVNTHEAKIFIRETYRAPSLKDVPSFSAERIDYVSFTPPELVHKKEEVVEALHQDEQCKR
ncbi:MAG: hypothetical protein UT61_C0037G0002 [Candidatus Woesebacteria bacterium GW2011_GWA1_39_8]|uniref:Uncharacterized protein n=1 Tax=Candidatus Woesebacteria bacterium GW2011_GWA1_39_8 TaxID=1618552 RepID=A0A0G0PLE7_9BACT|nr:MAG: hypothetical protein UT61_C0037G0002 [Candidatus Woesebacteria bacterium GW2011_GWA1_39_8]